MKRSKKIQFNNREIEVCELEVVQIRNWLETMKDPKSLNELHTLDVLMGKNLPVSAVRLAIPELTDEDLDGLPSEIKKLYKAVEELNPFLSQMAANVTTAVGKVDGPTSQ